MKRAFRAATATATATVIAFTAAPALAATHYAAPAGSGSNWPCTSSSGPCDLATAIQGNGTQSPASGDEVVVEPGTYTLTNEVIQAKVQEDIHGAAGQPAPVIDDAFTSGNVGEVISALELLDGGALTHVTIHVTQTGDDQITSAAASGGDTVFDRDTFSGTGSSQTDGVSLGPHDELLDTIAVANDTVGSAVFVDAYSGNSVTLRNVTAESLGTNSNAIFAEEGPDGGTLDNGCPPGTMTVSLRNVIAQVTNTGSAPLDGRQYCPGLDINFDVDYSDYNAALDSLPAGVTATAGTHSISAAPIFTGAAADPYDEAPNSPTVDKGTNDPQDGPLDVDGRARFLGSAPDIGAAELPAPDAVTGSATSLSLTGASLTGTVDPEDSDQRVYYRFEYGTSTAYGSQVPLPDATIAPAVTTIPDPMPVSETITGLRPATTYDFRLDADNSDGETDGANQTFTTPATLTVKFVGKGHGVVNGGGGCDATCTTTLAGKKQYTLTATPDVGSTFVGWQGVEGCARARHCRITLNGDRSVIALFIATPPRITRAALTGKHMLSFTVAAADDAPPLKALRVMVPKGVKLHGVKLSVRHAKLKLRHGKLTIMLARSASSVRVTVTLAHPTRSLVLAVDVTDANGTLTVIVRTVTRR